MKSEIKCRYKSGYIEKEYCDNKDNMDIRISKGKSKKILRKRCRAEFCPLLKIN